MIELTQVKSTDKLWQLQGIINTAFNEIKTNQPFVGLCQNISINFYNADTLEHAVTASALTGQKLYALCFPESNGVFVAKVWGRITVENMPTSHWTKAVIDIPAVKLPMRDAVVSTFVPPSHLGLGSNEPNVMELGTLAFRGYDSYPTAKAYTTSIAEHDSTCEVTLACAAGDAIEAGPSTFTFSI